jgi:hypothetical protein
MPLIFSPALILAAMSIFLALFYAKGVAFALCVYKILLNLCEVLEKFILFQLAPKLHNFFCPKIYYPVYNKSTGVFSDTLKASHYSCMLLV